MSSFILRLKPEQLGRLVPQVPFMLVWIRQEDKHAGELFLGSALDVDDDEVHSTLKELLDALDANEDLSNSQMKQLCATKSPAVWARCIHTLFASANPKIIPENISHELLDHCQMLPPGVDTQKVVNTLKPSLDKLMKNSHDALGQFCALIRDTSDDPDINAIAMGYTIFVGEKANDSSRKLAGLMFQLMVNNAEALFGKSGTKSNFDSLGVRSPDDVHDGLSIHPTGGASQDDKHSRHVKTLQDFFQWRDKGSVKIAEQLFEYYDFLEIAQGLNQKYGMVPSEWRDELAALKQAGEKGAMWFEASKTEKPKRFSLMPRINRKPNERKSRKITNIDRVINEIASTEAFYFDTMRDMTDLFVNEIQAIADGKRGPEAMKDLGISASQVAEVFGSRLENVLEVSNDLLSQLNLISIVTLPPKTDIGRAGIIANIFAEHALELKVYAPYISSHMAAIKTLKECLIKVERAEKLKASSSAKKLLGGGGNRAEINSFINIWYKVSQNSNYLRGQTIESVLIQPVQRVPRYKLLVETLLKDVPVEHPAHDLLQEALAAVKKAAAQINTAVKQHMKLENLFGQDTMLNPNSSKAKVDNEGNFLAIVNSYVG